MKIHCYFDLPIVCKECCFCSYFDEGIASWYFCSKEGPPFGQGSSASLVDSSDGICSKKVSYSELYSFLAGCGFLDDADVDCIVSLVKKYGI